jgi:hypothetical protein
MCPHLTWHPLVQVVVVDVVDLVAEGDAAEEVVVTSMEVASTEAVNRVVAMRLPTHRVHLRMHPRDRGTRVDRVRTIVVAGGVDITSEDTRLIERAWWSMASDRRRRYTSTLPFTFADLWQA